MPLKNSRMNKIAKSRSENLILAQLGAGDIPKVPKGKKTEERGRGG
jgi:hypothetical protein